MEVDQVEQFGQSLLQHGPANDRVYLMKLHSQDAPEVLDYIDELVDRHQYTKVFAKIPDSSKAPFIEAGYRVEARVPNFYQGQIDGLFMANYPEAGRSEDPAAVRVAEVLGVAQIKGEKAVSTQVQETVAGKCRLAQENDCPAMADLYRRVFASYPFPIHDPDYLAATMADQVTYAGVWQGNQLVALASAEIDHGGSHAEMTDFATDPAYRGQGLAHLLLTELESQVADVGIQTSYTIARATSFGMNITFAKSGYRFAGTLIQNTQISGGLESMNVWYKSVE